jgi:hypothetical protein
VNLQQGWHEVALSCRRERVQPSAREQRQYEKNGRPVQADCHAVERRTSRVDRRIVGPGMLAHCRNVCVRGALLPEQ